MKNQKHTWLICYDIADPKRLAKVHRIVRQLGLAIQYSVFVSELSERDVDRLLANLSVEIDASEDDIRAYPIDGREARVWGPQWVAAETYLLPHPISHPAAFTQTE